MERRRVEQEQWDKLQEEKLRLDRLKQLAEQVRHSDVCVCAHEPMHACVPPVLGRVLTCKEGCCEKA